MDLENKQWDLADQDLTLWLNEDKHESSHPLSDILKSTYLAFRQKQIARFSHICKQAFENYQEQERKREQKSLEELQDFVGNFRLSEPTKDYPRNFTPMFSKGEPLSIGELAELTRKENEKIIKGIIKGDRKVFNELYEHELPKVVRLVINNAGSVDMADDVFQDALVILIEKVYTKKLDLTCAVITYLYSICRFLWIDQLRQNKREIPLKDEYSYKNVDISVVGFADTPDIYENVNTAIAALGDPCKQLLECYYYKKLSWSEIARTLGYSSAASARNQKYKCLERIRRTVNVEVG